jgi:hypothetical protein
MTALTTVRSPSGAQFTVANPYAENFSGLLRDLEQRGYLADPRQSGGYANRNIDPKQTGGKAVPSLHKFGRAIDINWNDNARGTAGNISPGVARALAGKHGLTWGGDWKNPDAMHFEASGRGNAVLPVEQRGLLSFAGHPQAPVSGLAGGTAPAAPISNGSMPMPGQGLKVSEPAAYTGGTPGSVSNARRMAQMLMSQGMETGDVRHWTQALGKVLQSGVGAAWGDQANTQEQQGTASGSAALAAALAGGDMGPALANPYSADDAKGIAMAQYKQRLEQQDPMYQAKLKAAQAEAMGGGSKQPMNVQEWEYYSKLPPEQQQRYLTMKRAEKYLDTGTSFQQPNAANPTAPPVRVIPKDLAGAEREKMMGEMQGKQDSAAPSDLATADSALELINSIKNDPARERGTGMSSVGNVIPGTSGFDFQKKVDQAKSGAFLTAIQQMRGMGALSNAEGQTATQAVTRMSTAMTEQGFNEALADYERLIIQGRERALARTMRAAPMQGIQQPANDLKAKYGLE